MGWQALDPCGARSPRPGGGWASAGARRAGAAQGSQYPTLTPGGFTEARYGYGLTRQASDDIQFIARYLKIVIIVGLILLGVTLVIQLVTVFGSLLGFVGSITHR